MNGTPALETRRIIPRWWDSQAAIVTGELIFSILQKPKGEGREYFEEKKRTWKENRTVESAAELEMECLYIHDRTLAIVAKLLSGGRVTLEQNLLAECHMLLHMNHKIITDIFQYGVKKAFPGLVFESNSIDVRRGWKVVIVARPTQKVKKPKMWTKIWAFLKSALDRLADGGFLHT